MDIYKNRVQRLKRLLRENYNDNKTALANDLDIHQSYLSRFWTKNKTSHRNIGDKLARRIERVAHKEHGWLDYVDSRVDSPATGADSNELVEPAALDFIARIPIVGDTQAGRDGYWLTEVDHPDEASEYVDAPSRDATAYGLRIRGTSMWPRLREGDVLCVSPAAECSPGDYVIIRTTAGETLVKELIVCHPNEIILNSLSDAEPRIALRADDVELMHKVTAIVPGSMIITR